MGEWNGGNSDGGATGRHTGQQRRCHHTYPVTLGELGDAVDDAAYEAKALEAAAHGRLVSDAELGSLTARMHEYVADLDSAVFAMQDVKCMGDAPHLLEQQQC
ncbi:hypothetical protein P0D69_40945 [Paraburkholderia sediminicola]|uniref:hypothetical protein n=1 Tax=Paraburkholderia sediminicola TaxID=458836 RepID=UPI0038BD860F